jgi:hypothetical protein
MGNGKYVNYVNYKFDDWITIDLPETWVYKRDEGILNIYSTLNPKGAVQISFYTVEIDMTREEIAEDFLQRFIEQFFIKVDINTKMILERNEYTISTATGDSDGRFIKVWCLVEGPRVLLITYNSSKKTRELSTVDDFIYGIKFI